MAARRALALVLALAGAERARAALARGAARPVLTARHAAQARRASALRACDSCVGDSCPLPSDEEEDNGLVEWNGGSGPGGIKLDKHLLGGLEWPA